MTVEMIYILGLLIYDHTLYSFIALSQPKPVAQFQNQETSRLFTMDIHQLNKLSISIPPHL